MLYDNAGRRNRHRGHPTKTWCDCIKEDMKNLGQVHLEMAVEMVRYVCVYDHYKYM